MNANGLSISTSVLTAPLNSGFTRTVILGVSLIHTQQETQLKSESKTVNSDLIKAVVWACLTAGARLTAAYDHRYQSKLGTDKEMYIFRFGQLGAVATRPVFFSDTKCACMLVII